jgi:hypothetical protein
VTPETEYGSSSPRAGAPLSGRVRPPAFPDRQRQGHPQSAEQRRGRRGSHHPGGEPTDHVEDQQHHPDHVEDQQHHPDHGRGQQRHADLREAVGHVNRHPPGMPPEQESVQAHRGDEEARQNDRGAQGDQVDDLLELCQPFKSGLERQASRNPVSN